MLFDLMLRQSPENPTTSLSNPAAWLFDALGVRDDIWSGAKISERTALNNTAYYACVRVIAETLAQVPLKVYERLTGGGRRPAEGHPLWPLLAVAPNDQLSSFQFRELLVSHVVSWGNGYAEIVRDGAGRITELWPITPDRVTPERVGGRKFLVVRVGGSEVTLTPGNFLHVAGLGFDGLKGYSPIGVLRQSLGLGLAAEEYGARFFGAGGKPPLAIEHPGSLSPDAAKRMRQKFEAVHGSLSKAQRWLILDEGMTIKNIGVPHNDAQFLETRKFQVLEMARAHRLPPHMIGELENANYNNITAQALHFVKYSVHPWAARLEQAMNLAFFGPSERRYYVRFVLDGLMRGDARERAEALAIQRQWGIINADEWRELEDMNPQGGEQGQAYWMPVNMIPADQASMLTSPDAPPPDDDDDGDGERASRALREQRVQRSALARHRALRAYLVILERAIQHIVNREARALLRIIRTAFQSDRPAEELLARLAELWDSLADPMQRELAPAFRALAGVMQGEIVEEMGASLGAFEPDYDRQVEDFVSEVERRYLAISRQSVESVMAGAEAGEMEGALVELADGWQATRAAKVAQVEGTRAASVFSKAAYIALGAAGIRWITVGENCPLCDSLNGRTAGIREVFLQDGETVDPGDGKTAPLTVTGGLPHPPLHAGCDCMIGPA